MNKKITLLYKCLFLFSCFFFLNVLGQEVPKSSEKAGVKVSESLKNLSLQPASISKKYRYNSALDKYVYTEKLGDYDISTPMFLSKEEYEKIVLLEKSNVYFRERSSALTYPNLFKSKAIQKDLLPEFYIKSEFLQNILGGIDIDLTPQGSIEVDLGMRYSRSDNPSITPENRHSYSFDFDQRINLGVTGKVGKFLNVNAMYNTQSTFDFQNLLKLEYEPEEDDILRKIEFGNVSMSLNSSLITGAQSLFGVKTELQFGRTTVSAVFSDQRSQAKTLTSQGGGLLQDFEIRALDYDDNRNYFLSQFFRDNYDKALENYPFINSKVQITRIEVWATNRINRTSNIRNIVALQDLGEAVAENTRINANAPAGFFKGSDGNRPTNQANDFDPLRIGKGGVLTQDIRNVATVKAGFGTMANLVNEGFDYSILESAQKLEEGRDYRVDTQLGYISLSQRLNNDEILAVAYQYTYQGKVYQVGEFANDGISATTNVFQAGNNAITNNCLVLKMLKSNRVNTSDPMWNLMMKNVYSVNATQINPEGFRMNIFYTDPSPVNYITPVDETSWNQNLTKKTLLQVFNFDRLNSYNDPQNGGDGFFDFVPGITVDPEYGKIIFTKVEPFGEYLYKQLGGGNSYKNPTTYNANQKKYVFHSLYSDIKAKALEDAEKNKFLLKGRYKSEGGKGISLGAFNVPRGSVRVRVGGRLLQEGIDYTVNYQMGMVQIIDPTLENSNIPIEVSVEDNLIFGGQNRRFMGVNINHKVNDKLDIGASVINMRERPFTQKSNYGQEPVSNTILGFGATYSTEMPFLTRWLNKIPSMQSEVPSRLSFRGEMAYLLPSVPKGTDFNGEVTAYLDDFEAAQATIDIRTPNAWSLASTPLAFVPSGQLYGATPDDPDNLKNGYGRAKLAWYSIDPIFYSGSRPSDVSLAEISKNSTRRVFISEIFPEREVADGELLTQTTLDLAYYPSKKGPYNNNPKSLEQLTASDKWGGIMRGISTTNFEDNNVEYIQFWMLDPYVSNEFKPSNGELVFNLGNISEDVLKDGRKQYENGLPGVSSQVPAAKTAWGDVPVTQSMLYAFDTNSENRTLQDVGLDGLNDTQERSVYTNNQTETDPALDNYQYFLNRPGTILNRYLNYNGTEGNSALNISDSNRGATAEPDVEDANRDNTMNSINSYYEYRVPIKANIQRNDLFVNDIREVTVQTPNGDVRSRWIQFKIPIKTSERKSFGGDPDLRSITHLRMYVTGFNEDIVLRFGTLDLVRGDWRIYKKSLKDDLSETSNQTTLEVTSVNILENETRQPIPYRMPPGVYREQVNQNNSLIRENEQSLSLSVCALDANDLRAVYKNINADFRQYKRIKMFVHAEAYKNEPLSNGQMVAFIRLGSDFTENFYQVELPLEVTPNGAFSEDAIWTKNNQFNIPIELLTQLKARGINSGTLSQISYYDGQLNAITNPMSTPYTMGEQRYAIKGNPSFGNIRSLMIGVKNASTGKICGEVWFNELRLAELDNKGGWAAIGALDVNAADFANVSVTGRMSTVGFGSVEQRPNERSKEEIKQFDAMVHINAGKLLPKKWNMQIPLGINHSQSVITPEYDPQYEDIRLKDRLAMATSAQQKQQIENQAKDYTIRQGISLIGVKKGLSQGQKSRFYNPENFTFNYAYNQMTHSDFEIENQGEKNVRTGLMYAYGFQPLKLEPFKKNSFLKGSKYWRWLSDINLNLLPSTLNFSSNITRSFTHQRFRDVFETGVNPLEQQGLPELQQRNYLFDWQYGVNYNLTNSLKVSYEVTNNNIVRNYYDTNNLQTQTIRKELSIWNDFWNVGEANHYMSSFKLNYELPFEKIPYLSFIRASYSYTGDFDWQRGSQQLALLASEQINTIQNASTHNLVANASFDRLYRSLGIPVRGRTDEVSFKNYVLDILTMIKRVGLNYSQTNATTLPGYLPSVGFFGTAKPTLGFVFGNQDDVRYEAARRGWLTSFADFNDQFLQSTNKNLSFTASLQPLTDLQIELNADRQYTDTYNESFEVQGNSYKNLIGNQVGNFTISDNMISTAFSRSDVYHSKAFETFKENRLTIAKRLAIQRGINLSDSANIDENGFPKGFGKNNQAVLIPAFYAAYTGRNAEKVSLSGFKNIPIPAWTLRYTGLMRLEAFQNVFRRFSLTHGYRSSYSLNNFRSNLEFDAHNLDKLDQSGNYLNQQLFTNVSLVEQFSPLIRLDMEMKNTLSVLGEIRNERTISISLDNDYLTEIARKEYRLGLGYRFQDLRFRAKVAGEEIQFKGDLNLKADVSYRDDFTVIRNMELPTNQIVSGQTSWLARLTADYSLSEHLNAMYYIDYSFSKYAISLSFPQTTIRTGFTLRYTF